MKDMIRRLAFVFMPPLMLVFSLAIIEAQQQQPIPPSVANPAIKAIEDQLQKLKDAMVPPPPPVDCVLSAFEFKSATAWEPPVCPSTEVQTRTELWTRTIITEPVNGGLACGPLEETRLGEQTCVYAPTPGNRLLQQSDLIYEGAFRLPQNSAERSYNYGGQALTFNPTSQSLFLATNDTFGWVGEISIPTPSTASTLAALPRATNVQMPVDILAGRREDVDGSPGAKLGGLVLDNTSTPPSVVVSAWSYYDNQGQTLSHFRTKMPQPGIVPGDVSGPVVLSAGWKPIVPTAVDADVKFRLAGFVSGYMSTVPASWQAALGGTHLTGQGGKISIVGRTSSGPSASVFSAADLTKLAPIVMGYPSHGVATNPLNHPTLGKWEVGGGLGLYTGMEGFRGMVFPEGTRSILFFGWGGTTFCYGVGTDDPAKHLQPVPNINRHYCYDPTNSNLGTHGYPYTSKVFAYDVEDFIASKQGQKKPWDVVPYATWSFVLPFQQLSGKNEIVGAAYDPATKRIFLSAAFTEGAAPVIHVFKLP